MKIGFVFDDSLDKSDGVQQYLNTVGTWLTVRGHEVHYLVGQTKRTDIVNVHSLSRNISVNFNGNRLSIPLPTRKKRLKKLLKAEKFDVLHVQVPYSPFLAGKIISSAPVGTAVVGTFHILPYGRIAHTGNRILGKMLRRSLRRFDAHCAVSGAAQSFAREYYGIDAIVVPNAVETDRFMAQQAGSLDNQKAIVFLGRLVERKGAEQFLHAVAGLPAALRNQYDIVVAGKGPLMEKLKSYAQQRDLTVRFTGFISEEDKVNLLANAKIAVFPSLAGESFGIVLIEAMAAGSGVVLAGNNPGYSSVMETVPDSLIDPFDFTEQLGKVLTDEQFANRIHSQQQELVRHFNIAIVGPAIVRLYETAIAKQH